MQTLTILKKTESAERNALCHAALQAAKQTIVYKLEHGETRVTYIWDVRQK